MGGKNIMVAENSRLLIVAVTLASSGPLYIVFRRWYMMLRRVLTEIWDTEMRNEEIEVPN